MKKVLIKSGALLGIGALLLTASCKKEVVTGFTASKETVAIGEAVAFTDVADENRKKEDRLNTTYEWDFGDGNKSMDRNPSHIYQKAGTYQVSQTVSVNKNLEKGKSRKASQTMTITVEGPTADFKTAKTSYVLGEAILLENTTAEKSEGSETTYEWNVFSSNGTTQTLGWEKNISVKFDVAGDYTITLSARQGATTTTKSVQISVTGAFTPDANAATKAMIIGDWKGGTTAEAEAISGSANSGDCPSNGPIGVSTAANYSNIVKANFYVLSGGMGKANVIRATGTQTNNTVDWTLSANGKFLTITGGAGFLVGNWEIKRISATEIELEEVNVNTCNSSTTGFNYSTYTHTRTVKLTK